MFTLDNVGMRFNGTPVLRGVSLEFTAAGMTAIAGPNGAGKSTLLGIMSGLRAGYGGSCRYRGREVREWPRRAMAREVSFVPQSLRLEFPFTAEQVVLMGRTPHCRGLYESAADLAAVESAMGLTDTLAFRQRDFRSLSGGERQRVVLASALAQEPKVLLLDEPTTFLDLEHQVSIYGLLAGLCRDGLTVITVTHDLNLAAAYAGRLILLRAGEVADDGVPSRVLSPERLREVFRIDAEVRCGPQGRPWVLYGG